MKFILFIAFLLYLYFSDDVNKESNEEVSHTASTQKVTKDYRDNNPIPQTSEEKWDELTGEKIAPY